MDSLIENYRSDELKIGDEIHFLVKYEFGIVKKIEPKETGAIIFLIKFDDREEEFYASCPEMSIPRTSLIRDIEV